MFRIQKLMWVGVSALAMLGCHVRSEPPKSIIHSKVDVPEVRLAAAGVQGANGMPVELKGSASMAIHRVTLSAEASRRLGIQFADVTGSGDHAELPYNALLYDASGGEWVFVSPAPNVYMRTEVKVEKIEGDKVIYSKGPAPGGKVVTMGAAELYGIEFGVGK